MAEEDEQWLQSVFERVDTDRSGHINATELQEALRKGKWKKFNPETVRLMIGMFDRDNSATISYQEFIELWRYVNSWHVSFHSVDHNISGNIDRNELKQALTTFGYRLSDQFYKVLIATLNRDENGRINFVEFLQLNIKLQTLINEFRYHDNGMDGWINTSYEQFISHVLNVCVKYFYNTEMVGWITGNITGQQLLNLMFKVHRNDGFCALLLLLVTLIILGILFIFIIVI